MHVPVDGRNIRDRADPLLGGHAEQAHLRGAKLMTQHCLHLVHDAADLARHHRLQRRRPTLVRDVDQLQTRHPHKLCERQMPAPTIAGRSKIVLARLGLDPGDEPFTELASMRAETQYQRTGFHAPSASRARKASSLRSTKSRRSCPQNRSSPMTKVGAPKMPSRSASAENWR